MQKHIYLTILVVILQSCIPFQFAPNIDDYKLVKGKRFKNGPLMPPGTYTVRLRVGENTLSQSVQVVQDPRVLAEGITAALSQKQYGIQRQITQLLSDARRLQNDLEQEVKSLEAKKDDSSVTARLEKIKPVLKALKNEEGAYPQQMLVAQISYIYNMVNGADQILGQDVLERLEELTAQFSALKAGLN